MSTSKIDTETFLAENRQDILMYTTSWCGDCRRARKVFAALEIPYSELDIEDEPEAAEQVKRLNNGMQSVPTILFADGTILVEPSTRVLETKLASLAKDSPAKDSPAKD
ncbi:MAG: glutaredoxin domain-containing protein [Ktedonobacterales bacterium]